MTEWDEGYEGGFDDGGNEADRDWARILEEEFDIDNVTRQNVVSKILEWYSRQGGARDE